MTVRSKLKQHWDRRWCWHAVLSRGSCPTLTPGGGPRISLWGQGRKFLPAPLPGSLEVTWPLAGSRSWEGLGFQAEKPPGLRVFLQGASFGVEASTIKGLCGALSVVAVTQGPRGAVVPQSWGRSRHGLHAPSLEEPGHSFQRLFLIRHRNRT